MVESVATAVGATQAQVPLAVAPRSLAAAFVRREVRTSEHHECLEPAG